jgi:hypothetical protein
MTLPPFLSDFDAGALSEAQATIIAIDAAGAIAWTNAAWSRFAEANGGDDIARRFGLGASYFEGISVELRSFFENAFAGALVTREPFHQDYECSTHEIYRLHHLRAMPIGTDGLLLEHSLVVESAHQGASSPAIEARYRDESGTLVQCSNCRRVRTRDGEGWDWVPAWVQRSPKQTSHGICKTCVGFYWGVRGGA